MLTKINVSLESRSYPIYIGDGILSDSKLILSTIHGNQVVIVTDSNVANFHLNAVKKRFYKDECHTFILSAGEESKNFVELERLLSFMLENNINRNATLIALGGGVVGDLAGFAAASYQRGISYVQMPTTLLAQVDSSVGGKTGVNTKEGKNLIGSFYQPKIVLSDTEFLNTLPKREIICGYGEILKHSLILNKNFYNYLDKYNTKILNLKKPFIEKAIFESCKIKKLVVEKDEKENGIRKILNFGHTFAHAYEASLKYSKKLNHGEAVILGIATALKFSLKIKVINFKEYKLIMRHIKNTKLPSNIKKYFSSKNLNSIISFMIKDKKNTSNKINLILLNKIGSAVIKNEYEIFKIKNFLKKELAN